MTANVLSEGSRRPNEYSVDLSMLRVSARGQGGPGALVRVVDDIQTFYTPHNKIVGDLLEAASSLESTEKFVGEHMSRYFSRPDRVIASRAISFSIPGSWRYGFRPLDNTGTLFENDGLPGTLQYPEHALPANNLDTIILSGAAGQAMLEAVEDDEVEQRLDRILFSAGLSRLRQMQILGALVFRYTPIDEKYARVPAGSLNDGRPGHYMVGNDLNGDFAIQQVLFAGKPNEEILNPLGEKTKLIRPVASNEFITATYHDFVPLIRGMLDHLRFELPTDEVGVIKQDLLASIPENEGKNTGTGQFGNFGDFSLLEIGETKEMHNNPRDYQEGAMIESGLSNTMGINNHHYILIHYRGGLELQQASVVVEGDKSSIMVEKFIVIPNSDIPLLVKAMVRQQSSRASDMYVAWTIDTVLPG